MPDCGIKVCRLCLSDLPPDAEYTCMHSEGRDSTLLWKRLTSSFPEVTLRITNTLIICNDCSAAVEFVCKFKRKVRQIDRHLKAYMEQNRNFTTPIDLNTFLQNLQEHTTVVDLDISSTSESSIGAENIKQETTKIDYETFFSQHQLMQPVVRLINIDTVKVGKKQEKDVESKNKRLNSLIERCRKNRSYTCTVCSYQTNIQEKLKQHETVNHPAFKHKKHQKKVNVFPIVYKCDTCNKKTTLERLKNHLKKYPGHQSSSVKEDMQENVVFRNKYKRIKNKEEKKKSTNPEKENVLSKFEKIDKATQSKAKQIIFNRLFGPEPKCNKNNTPELDHDTTFDTKNEF